MSKRHFNNILEVKDLNISFSTDEGEVRAVNGVNFKIPRGKAVGIVGESGCGKSVTAFSILRLLPKKANINSGQIIFKDNDKSSQNIVQYGRDSKEMQKIRAGKISIIFQEPMSAFSPVYTINNQISEAIKEKSKICNREARLKTIELMKMVGIPNAEARVDDYPFQFSGGMRQRAMIAMALAGNPKLLIADEPTTALDVTIQAQVLNLVKELQDDYNLSLMLITHDLGVVAHMVDYIYVMYLGRVIENGSVKEIFSSPYHPYTKGLLKSIPKLKDSRGERIASINGTVPDGLHLPSGCPFHPRCLDLLGGICKNEVPENTKIKPEHEVSCFLYSEKGMKQDDRDVK